MNKKMIGRTRELHVEIRDSLGSWLRLPDPDKDYPIGEYVRNAGKLSGKDNVRVLQTVLTTYVVLDGWERTGTKEERGEHK